MTYELHVSVATLRAAASVLLAHLEQLEGGEVALREDYFWSIPDEAVYDVRSKPDTLTIGQLSESLANVDSIIAEPGSAVSYGLVWLGDILRAIGHQVVRWELSTSHS
ncbi:hypothetical protein [Microbacterium sp. NPDC090003]|uniref:hypothetical protein n=1 Tax=Microbacterium sp. NPDC090003 TaxID=3364203 RepID=UPI0038077E07